MWVLWVKWVGKVCYGWGSSGQIIFSGRVGGYGSNGWVKWRCWVKYVGHLDEIDG